MTDLVKNAKSRSFYVVGTTCLKCTQPHPDPKPGLWKGGGEEMFLILQHLMSFNSVHTKNLTDHAVSKVDSVQWISVIMSFTLSSVIAYRVQRSTFRTFYIRRSVFVLDNKDHRRIQILCKIVVIGVRPNWNIVLLILTTNTWTKVQALILPL